MLPLALILKGRGFDVYGSDRSFDTGKTSEKFAYLSAHGITMAPQDGSGVRENLTALVVSTAIEDTIPDVRAAREKGVQIVKRAELLAQLFNQARRKISVAGTSGKTTVTGMIGYILKETGRDPTVMNGGVFNNYRSQDPYCSALTGNGDFFVTEADESDGSIALYNPDIAVLNNIALDHKSLEELNALFGDYLSRAQTAVLNADHPAVMRLSHKARGMVTYSLRDPAADFMAKDIAFSAGGAHFTLRHGGKEILAALHLPGEHNVQNALAALAACHAAGVPIKESLDALANFSGIWRRLDTVGSRGGITVIDDFAHNPDKITASLKALKQSVPSRLLIFFQPHGYAFLKLAYRELADSFSQNLHKGDALFMVQPFYAGGTVDRSIDSSHVIDLLRKKSIDATLMEDRTAVKSALLVGARSGDTIVIMGARDDTLAEFAKEIYDSLP